MPTIDGKKFACRPCVRGHRVSGCHHTDRPLELVNPKGRPTSQCKQCRSMRRSKSAHVKCDCGKKISKCVHHTIEGHPETCCCNHGDICTCCQKKESLPLRTAPESYSEKETAASVNTRPSRGSAHPKRSRANTQNSDGMLFFDEHGQHKPAHKHNKASQKTGPYQLSRANSMHSTGSLTTRSVDNLSTGSPASPGVSCTRQDQRMVRSEAASPLMTGAPLQASTTFDPSSASSQPFELFNDQPMFSAGLSDPPEDWNNYAGLDFPPEDTNKFAPSSYGQPPPFYDPAPGLMTSGEGSEVEDFNPSIHDDFDALLTISRTNTGSTGFGLGPDIPANVDLSSIEYFTDDLKLKKDANKALPSSLVLGDDWFSTASPAGDMPTFSLVNEDPAFWVADYNSGIPNSESPDSNPESLCMMP